MKKLIMVFGIASGLLMMSSCERDWVCTCTDQSGNVSNHDINNELLINARSKCRDMGYSHTVGGITTSEDCTLQ